MQTLIANIDSDYQPSEDPRIEIMRGDSITHVYQDGLRIGYAVRTRSNEFILAGRSKRRATDYVPVGDAKYEGDAVAKIVMRERAR